VLRASDTAIESATPRARKLKATEAAPAIDRARELSRAASSTLPASMLPPSTVARVWTAMRFSAQTPEPATATPSIPDPTVIAIEAANTVAPNVCVLPASSATRPPLVSVAAIA
jgi:hypothetical protein